MGFSTSGSALLVFAAMFLALGSIHGAASTAVEAINGAEADKVSHSVAIHETSLTITDASHNTSTDVFRVNATNTGEQALTVDDLTVVADEAYVPQGAFETITVDGRSSRVWLPGSELRLEDTDGSVAGLVDGTSPNYVKLVTSDGVAALAEVTTSG